MKQGRITELKLRQRVGIFRPFQEKNDKDKKENNSLEFSVLFKLNFQVRH